MKKIISLLLFWLCIILITIKIAPDESANFFQSYKLWTSPLLSGIIIGPIVALSGYYLYLTRNLFLGFAMTQTASTGIFGVLFLQELFWNTTHLPFLTSIGGIICGLIPATMFKLVRRKESSMSSEIMTALFFLAGSGSSSLIADRLSEGHHLLEHMLTGSLISITNERLLTVLSLGILILFLHRIFLKRFIYTVADESFMRAAGHSTLAITRILRLLIAGTLVLSLDVIGAIPTFCLMAIPVATGTSPNQNLRLSISLTLITSLLIIPLGYFFSFVFSLPTGGSCIAVGILGKIILSMPGILRLTS